MGSTWGWSSSATTGSEVGSSGVGVGAGAPPQADKTSVNKTKIAMVLILVFIYASKDIFLFSIIVLAGKKSAY
jgi:hypothetical protein